MHEESVILRNSFFCLSKEETRPVTTIDSLSLDMMKYKRKESKTKWEYDSRTHRVSYRRVNDE
jgi:hypothetical protein